MADALQRPLPGTVVLPRRILKQGVPPLGVDAPDATNAHHHDLQVTQSYLDSLPPRVRDHLTYRVTDALEVVEQHHVIEGLLQPDYG